MPGGARPGVPGSEGPQAGAVVHTTGRETSDEILVRYPIWHDTEATQSGPDEIQTPRVQIWRYDAVRRARLRGLHDSADGEMEITSLQTVHKDGILWSQEGSRKARSPVPVVGLGGVTCATLVGVWEDKHSP